MRDAIVVETKTFNPMEAGADRGLSDPRRRQVEASLGRLGLDRLPLYLAHEFDPDVPQEETLQAFDELVRTGKVGAVGASNFSAEQLAEALGLSELEGLARYEWCRTPSPSSTTATPRTSSPCATSTGSATRRSGRSRAAG